MPIPSDWKIEALSPSDDRALGAPVLSRGGYVTGLAVHVVAIPPRVGTPPLWASIRIGAVARTGLGDMTVSLAQAVLTCRLELDYAYDWMFGGCRKLGKEHVVDGDPSDEKVALTCCGCAMEKKLGAVLPARRLNGVMVVPEHWREWYEKAEA